MHDPKDCLHRYLQVAGDSLLWKLDGLSDHDGGMRGETSLLPDGDESCWAAYRERSESAARQASTG